MNYRAEIDGLRALAVVPVVLFHAGFKTFSGGFVGVDVFFVISGYLITTIIIKQIDENKFSFFNFLLKRARRIFPALLFITLVTALVLPIAFFPPQTESLGESILSVPIFLSNFYFNNSIDYFNNETANIPLLHTWSLSIEWQFYWVFPLLFLAIYKPAKKQTLTLLYIFVIASILFVQLGGNLNFSEPYIDKNFRLFNQPTFINYYSPLGRAWEFVFGSIAALHIVKKGPLSGSIGNAFSLLGLAMILITAMVFDSATIFPSIYTIFPVLGATLIILGGSNDNFVSKLLSHKILSRVGLASYSIYLWHLPIFVFVRQYGFKLNDPLVFAPVTGAIGLLSYLSWKYIETPFRNPIKIPNSNFLTHTAIVTSFLLALGGTYIYTKGFIDFYTPRDRILLKSRTEFARYVTKRFNERSTANFSESDTLKVALIGDSYAQDFLNVIIEGGLLNKAKIITRYIPKACQIFYSYDQISMKEGKSSPYCFPKNGKTPLENTLPLISHADVVIFASSWESWAYE